jgi:hypothetical protein
VVGLVEHGDLDRAEVAVALLDQVLEAAGAGEDDVDAVAQALDLGSLADATEDGLGLEAEGLGERRQRLLDLADQLAGRRQDQRARGLGGGTRVRLREPGHHREQEGVGLARAGAAAAEHVATLEGVGQRRRLDGRGNGDVTSLEDRDEVRGHAELGETEDGRAGHSRVHVDSLTLVCLTKSSRRRRGVATGTSERGADPVLRPAAQGARGKTGLAAEDDTTGSSRNDLHRRAGPPVGPS